MKKWSIELPQRLSRPTILHQVNNNDKIKNDSPPWYKDMMDMDKALVKAEPPQAKMATVSLSSPLSIASYHPRETI